MSWLPKLKWAAIIIAFVVGVVMFAGGMIGGLLRSEPDVVPATEIEALIGLTKAVKYVGYVIIFHAFMSIGSKS